MPFSAPHPCSAPGCPALVPRGRARCDAHERARTADRRHSDTSQALYNDRRWRAFRKQWLSDPLHALCEQCKREGRVTAGVEVDHVEPHKGDAVKFWAGPFQTLCTPCHSRKTATSAGGFGR